MDGDNSLNTRNWGYYEPTPSQRSNHLGLQFMSTTMPGKPLLDTRNASAMAAPPGGAGPFLYARNVGTPIPPQMYSMEYMKDVFTQRGFTGHPNTYSFLPEPSSTVHHMQMVQPLDLCKAEKVAKVEEGSGEIENGNGNGNGNSPSKNRQGGPKGGPKSPKPKKAKKGPQVPKAEKGPSVPRARSVKKSTEVMVNGIIMDISSIPIPICSCTGTPQQCYRWGSGGWQSACCTTGVSIYPLPMSTKRRGARIAGRKMSLGAFKKVLEKHASEGYNFANPIDLKTHWAKHGTNKFVTIR